MEIAKMLYYRQWIKKMYLYAMDFYSAKKKKGILLFSGKWMELDNVILSEVRLRRPKAVFSLLYVEYKPNINAAIL
jgi:hypothetical protein